MAADDGRLERLEKRLSALEDQVAIYQLLMTYGPSADSGSDDVVRAMHHPDAEYDSGLEVFSGGDGDTGRRGHQRLSPGEEPTTTAM